MMMTISWTRKSRCWHVSGKERGRIKEDMYCYYGRNLRYLQRTSVNFLCVSSLIMSHCPQSTGLVPIDSALSPHFSQLKNLRTLSPPKRRVENQRERCLNADFAACFKFLLPIWCFSGLHVQAGRPTMVAPYQGTLSPLHDCLVEHLPPPLLQLPFWNWSKMKNGLSELMKETPDQSSLLRHQD